MVATSWLGFFVFFFSLFLRGRSNSLYARWPYQKINKYKYMMKESSYIFSFYKSCPQFKSKHQLHSGRLSACNWENRGVGGSLPARCLGSEGRRQKNVGREKVASRSCSGLATLVWLCTNRPRGWWAVVFGIAHSCGPFSPPPLPR